MTPVQTYRNGRLEVYLPGSSLKGVVRSHVEKVCRTLRSGIVCNPFVKTSTAARVQNGRLTCPDFADVACSDKFEVREKGEVEVGGQTWRRVKEELDNPQVYADSCPVCRLFGSTAFIGRASIGDAYLTTWGRAH
jgi:CRISPR/Cas system CSM-associated protein Csm3 (group 7 of RAMP superfamily)